MFEPRIALHFLLRARMGLNIAFGRVRFCTRNFYLSRAYMTRGNREISQYRKYIILCCSRQRYFSDTLSYIFCIFIIIVITDFLIYQKNLLQIKLELDTHKLNIVTIEFVTIYYVIFPLFKISNHSNMLFNSSWNYWFDLHCIFLHEMNFRNIFCNCMQQ